MNNPRHILLGLAVSLLVARPALAQAPPAGPAQEATAKGKLDAAKLLFRQGVDLFNTGDNERALDYFLRSRAAYPSVLNAINAAICLERLQRYDEALEMYEEALTRHAAELQAADRATVGPAMTALREKVGSIQVSANVEGTVTVDGRARGKLPLTTSIRVMPGKRLVRVLKDGYTTQETTVEVKIGQTAKVDLRLDPAKLGQEAAPPPPAPQAPAPADGGAKRVAGFVVGGVGVAGIGVGAVFGALTLSSASKARNDPTLCPGNLCTPKGREVVDAAGTKGLVSTVALGAGAAALTAGVILVAVSSGPRKAPAGSASRLTIHPWAGREGGGLGAVGTF
jgi:hypothetical protein